MKRFYRRIRRSPRRPDDRQAGRSAGKSQVQTGDAHILAPLQRQPAVAGDADRGGRAHRQIDRDHVLKDVQVAFGPQIGAAGEHDGDAPGKGVGVPPVQHGRHQLQHFVQPRQSLIQRRQPHQLRQQVGLLRPQFIRAHRDRADILVQLRAQPFQRVLHGFPAKRALPGVAHRHIIRRQMGQRRKARAQINQ